MKNNSMSFKQKTLSTRGFLFCRLLILLQP